MVGLNWDVLGLKEDTKIRPLLHQVSQDVVKG